MYLVHNRLGWKLCLIVLFSILLTAGGSIMPAQAKCKGKGCTGGEPPPPGVMQEIVTVQDAGNHLWNIVVMNADGTDAQIVWKGERWARFNSVSWSADGSKVLFHGDVHGQTGIYWIRVFIMDNGTRVFAPGEPELVTTTTFSASFPRWSPTVAPDGQEWIAYADADAGTGIWQIWLVDPDAPHERIRLSDENSTRFEWFPTWAPDAGRIAFSSISGIAPAYGDIVILELGVGDTDSIEVTNRVSLILENPDLSDLDKEQWKDADFWYTDWANNGDWIATTSTTGRFQIWVFPTSPSDVESKAKNVTGDPELDYLRPVWSPDDKALLFERDSYGGVCDIPDNNDTPYLQGGPRAFVIAPLLPNPPTEIEALDICNATSSLDWLGLSWEWWRGGKGVPPAPAP